MSEFNVRHRYLSFYRDFVSAPCSWWQGHILKVIFERLRRGTLCCAFTYYVSVNAESCILPPSFCRVVHDRFRSVFVSQYKSYWDCGWSVSQPVSQSYVWKLPHRSAVRISMSFSWRPTASMASSIQTDNSIK